jgi:Cu-processing system permease protein
LLLGKFFGLALAVALGTVLGFGLGGITIGLVAPVAGLGTYLLFVALVVALGMAMLSIAVLVSVLSDTRAKAMVFAILVWFGLVIFYDLAIVVLTTTVGMGTDSLLLAIIMNPVEVARILTVLALEPDLKVLGPLGAFMVETFGTWGSAALLTGVLVAWMVAPLGLALMAFSFPDE